MEGVVNCMIDSVAGASPRQPARIAGALYLINIVGGAFAIGFVRAAVFTPDLATTAALRLLLLIIPIGLLILSIRLRAETAATLVQATILKTGEPPVLTELREVQAVRKDRRRASTMIGAIHRHNPNFQR
jgi:hypothetical protein